MTKRNDTPRDPGDPGESEFVRQALTIGASIGLPEIIEGDLGVRKASTQAGLNRIMTAAAMAQTKPGGRILLLQGSEELRRPDTAETALEKHQVEWVKARIEAGFEESRATLGPQLKPGDASLPDKADFVKSALADLKKEHVEFMMRKGVAEFGFQIKPVCASLKRLRSIVDGQPHTMDLADSGQKQQALNIWGLVEKHLQPTPPTDESITAFKWEFVQNQQIIEPFTSDDPSKTDDLNQILEVREQRFRNWRPEGMDGTDDATWAMLEADGLRRGKPLDCKFPNDATDTTRHAKWNVTVLDKKGYLTEGMVRCLVGGYFDPGFRRANLASYGADARRDFARFRASVSGLCKVPLSL